MRIAATKRNRIKRRWRTQSGKRRVYPNWRRSRYVRVRKVINHTVSGCSAAATVNWLIVVEVHRGRSTTIDRPRERTDAAASTQYSMFLPHRQPDRSPACQRFTANERRPPRRAPSPNASVLSLPGGLMYNVCISGNHITEAVVD